MSTAVASLYTVAIGDSLSKIAQKFYGDPAKYPLIAERNNVNPQAILMIGQRLIIPAAPSTVKTSDIAPVSVTAETPNTAGAQPLETVTVQASVWYKDWRYWAAISVGIGAVWYLTRRR
jgi:LysM repeat protein